MICYYKFQKMDIAFIVFNAAQKEFILVQCFSLIIIFVLSLTIYYKNPHRACFMRLPCPNTCRIWPAST